MRRKYKYINQKKNNCFPTCLQMILERNNIKGYNQDKIASFFERNEEGFIRIKDINKQFFLPNKINLKEIFFPFKEIEMTGMDNIKDRFDNSNNDYMLFTNLATLTSTKEELEELRRKDDEKLYINHCFLIEGIKDENNVILVCPETAGKGGTEFIVVTLDQIYQSMDRVVHNAGFGISEISKLKY